MNAVERHSTGELSPSGTNGTKDGAYTLSGRGCGSAGENALLDICWTRICVKIVGLKSSYFLCGKLSSILQRRFQCAIYAPTYSPLNLTPCHVPKVLNPI